MAGDHVLTVDAVVKEYGSKRVVDRVSLDVKRGEIMGFLGPNGAGKTTTIRMIMGITAPDEGKIVFHLNGKPSSQIPKARVGYLPEERGLYREARVMEILVFLGGLKGLSAQEARKRAKQWLERMGLGAYANAKVNELSKGMAQKVQFIAAVMHDPDLVVLDEPYSGLDPVNQDVFKREIIALADRGCAVLLSSHQMNLVEETCHRLFLINKGKRVLYGPIREIKAEYGVHRVVMVVNDPKWRLPESRSVESVQRDGQRWTCLLRPGTEPVDFLRELPPQSPIEEISVARISLHDIFVRIAQGGEAA